MRTLSKSKIDKTYYKLHKELGAPIGLDPAVLQSLRALYFSRGQDEEKTLKEVRRRLVIARQNDKKVDVYEAQLKFLVRSTKAVKDKTLGIYLMKDLITKYKKNTTS